MPEIRNNFIKSKMNKDLDDRLVPNGEYRDAKNLQISRSEGSSVGEFENIPGNQLMVNGVGTAYLNTGYDNGNVAPNLDLGYTGKVIGQCTDETRGDIYVFSTGYTGTAQQPRDIVVYSGAALQSGTTITLWTEGPGGLQLNPQVLGIEVGMLVQGCDWNGNTPDNDPLVIEVTATDNVISQSITLAGGALVGSGDKLVIGWANTIHRYNINDQILTLLARGSWLNFSQNNRIYGINLIEDLLFWTDNRNQPRRINVNSANPDNLPCPNYYTNEDQISVAKYYPYEVPLVLDQNILEITAGAQSALRGYTLTMADTTGIQVGDIVTGFPGQLAQELWEVILIDPNVSVTIYNNFKDGGAGQTPGTYASPSTIDITFSRPTMENANERLEENGFETTFDAATAVGPIVAGTAITLLYPYNNTAALPTGQPTPNVGDLVTSTAASIAITDDVRIYAIDDITPGAAGTITIRLTKDITTTAVGPAGDDISVSANPDYDAGFTGDPDFIEDKFVRFSYRFKFVDNEYSLSAPFTQICFIPKQEGIFGGGPQDSLQDMTDTYTSSIVQWFENRVDQLALKIPLPDDGLTAPDALTALSSNYQVASIEILYKESDGLSTKILESIDVDTIGAGEITGISSNTTTQWYYTFDYKSIKPYRTVPSSQDTRVYDKVPVKALAQEIIGNRVTYGNYTQNHTPPTSIDYQVTYNNKSLVYNNYSQYPNHTVKQNRNYQVGWVLSDRYGRQSSVVLSKNDDDQTKNGSTIYIPYKTWNDISNPIDDITTYKWLGSVLRVIVDNGITQVTKNDQTGEPGIYKSYNNTTADSFSIVAGGTLYNVGNICGVSYPAGDLGLGSGFSFEVTQVDGGGGITGGKILDGGTGYATGQILDVTGGTGSGAQIEVTVNPVNVLGWGSYKFVVKQQEQEYYNVYLPGFVDGYPVTQAIDRGRVAFTILLSDNINKVPRDLNEVGPLQNEFSASVKIFGRVNNPNIDNKQAPAAVYYNSRTLPWNTRYFPGRNPDEVVTIGPVGQGGLELANSPFDSAATKGNFTNDTTGPQIPWGAAGAEQSFYNVEQNPLAAGIKVGSEESQPQLTQPGNPILNTLGAYVTGNALPPGVGNVGCMVPFLSVSETEPVESLLEIFYETSTSGNFVFLNDEVLETYGGVVSATSLTGNVAENDTVPTDIITDFKFTDPAGNWITLDAGAGVGATIIEVLDNNGNDVTSPSPPFSIVDTPAGVLGRDFDIITNQEFWYGKPSGSKADSWTISFRTISGSGAYVDDLNNITTISLTNVAPVVDQVGPPAAGFYSYLDLATRLGAGSTSTGFIIGDTNIGTFIGQNGSIDLANDTQELCWSIAATAVPGGSTAVFGIDSAGVVTVTGGSLVNGTYTLEATLTDAAPACSSCPESLSSSIDINFVVGTPDTDQAICYGLAPLNYFDFGLYPANKTTCASDGGKPFEAFFGVSNNVNNGTGVLPFGSETNSYLSSLPAPAGSGLTSYPVTSTNGTNLVYYNVKTQALATWVAGSGYCGLPPVSPAFTTGALSQGIMTVVVQLNKALTASSTDYNTNFTILYRANAAASWTQATDRFGVIVGTWNALNVTGAGSATASLTYEFDTPGEYAIRNNGLSGPGCASFAGDGWFSIDFYDTTTGKTATPCADCTGPL